MIPIKKNKNKKTQLIIRTHYVYGMTTKYDYYNKNIKFHNFIYSSNYIIFYTNEHLQQLNNLKI